MPANDKHRHLCNRCLGNHPANKCDKTGPKTRRMDAAADPDVRKLAGSGSARERQVEPAKVWRMQPAEVGDLPSAGLGAFRRNVVTHIASASLGVEHVGSGPACFAGGVRPM